MDKADFNQEPAGGINGVSKLTGSNSIENERPRSISQAEANDLSEAKAQRRPEAQPW